MVFNPWTYVGVIEDTDFVHNDAVILSQDAHRYEHDGVRRSLRE
eukprot:COSAG04_NODE_960_length_9157_cov_6.389269_9_plen_44_part_00